VANSIAITLDSAAIREALEGDSLKAVLREFVKAASRVSADHVCAEAKIRLARQLSGHSTGETVEQIRVRSAGASGWVVIAGNARVPRLDFWLERGFKNELRRKPFLFASVAARASAARGAHPGRHPGGVVGIRPRRRAAAKWRRTIPR
jgi:hypothetical protein